MREIKFRGKRLDNGKWWYGSLVISYNGAYTIIGEKHGTHEVDPETVGQYTGLNLDGKELYEGDLLRRWLPESKMINPDGGEWWVCEIKFLCGAWRVCQVGFEYMEDYHPELLYDELRDYDYELIGNIHDNPELIKP